MSDECALLIAFLVFCGLGWPVCAVLALLFLYWSVISPEAIKPADGAKERGGE